MMKFEKTYIFLIRFSVVLIALMIISLIVNSISEAFNKNSENSNFFPEIKDNLVDSVISNLSLDEKISMFFQEDYQDEMNFQHSDTNHIDIDLSIDSVLLKSADSVVCDSNQVAMSKKIKFIEFTRNALINSITDTSFLCEYLLHLSNLNDSAIFYFMTLNFDTAMLTKKADSAFVDFLLARNRHYQHAFRKQHKLIGLKIDGKQLADLYNNGTDNHPFPVLDSFINNGLDLLFIDSVSTVSRFPVNPKGILVAKLKSNALITEDQIFNMFESKVDLIILSRQNVEKCKQNLYNLISRQKIPEDELDNKIRKLVKIRLWMNSKSSNQIPDNHSHEYFSGKEAQLSMILLNNPDSLLPVTTIFNRRFNLFWIGNSFNINFLVNCNNYVAVNKIQLAPGKADWNKRSAYQSKNAFNIIVLDTLLTDTADINQFKSMVDKIESKSLVVLNFAGYNNLAFVPPNVALIQVQSRFPDDYRFSAQAIFGGIAIQGQMPVSFENYKFGQRLLTSKTRLKYSIPEEVGIDAEKLKEIDLIANSAILNGAFPGCQVFVAKNGQVIYDKCFGYHSYSREIPVKESDVYDLASVTKIAATTIAAMKMISDGKMSLNDALGKFFKDTRIDYTRIKDDTLINIDTFYNGTIKNWPKFLQDKDTTNISDTSFIVTDTVIYKLTPRLNIFKVPVVDLLRHQSGIAPALPIFRYMYYKAYFIKQLKEQFNALYGRKGSLFDYKTFGLPENFPENTKLSDSLKSKIYRGFNLEYNEYFSHKYVKDSSDIALTDNLFLRNRYFDTIWRDTKQLPVYGRKVFIYSDINMILMQFAIDSLNKTDMDTYMKKTFYNPLGLRNISYLPLKYFSKNQIVPTVLEKVFRYGYLLGYVHDPSAALLGGMAGNAGLFASAHDLGILFQMVLNHGSYGGINYIKPSIIQQFTTRLDETQRGLGFDMPNRKARVGSKAPLNTFGHSGYTGTCVWVDPDNEIVYVFLANRNNPNDDNWKILSLSIRERIHDAIYNSIIKKKESVGKNQPEL